jgi:hypothetical protein
MLPLLAIARDADGKPLKRAVIASTRDLIYLANPELLPLVDSGESYPVGFPAEYVYEYENTEFLDITKIAKTVGRVLEDRWNSMRPNLCKSHNPTNPT